MCTFREKILKGAGRRRRISSTHQARRLDNKDKCDITHLPAGHALSHLNNTRERRPFARWVRGQLARSSPMRSSYSLVGSRITTRLCLARNISMSSGLVKVCDLLFRYMFFFSLTDVHQNFKASSLLMFAQLIRKTSEWRLSRLTISISTMKLFPFK